MKPTEVYYGIDIFERFPGKFYVNQGGTVDYPEAFDSLEEAKKFIEEDILIND